MHKFVRNLLTEWRKLKLPFENASFIVAVSGGADSVSLLLALSELRGRKKLGNRFVAAHFNHNLRGQESEKDAAHVRELCEKLNIELALEKGNLPEKGNLEQNARHARYEFLIRTAENLQADGILTAHTLNDQAETFLINLIRGSGLRGLSGIKAVQTDFSLPISETKPKTENQKPKTEIQMIRPLINWAQRTDTENFCDESKIDFRRDEMNEDLRFNRVRVRKILLPLLADFNPKIIETLAQTARLLRLELEVLKEAEDRRPKTENRELALKDLKSLSKPMLFHVLRRWLEANRGDLRQLDLKHLESIERLVFSRKSGRTVELPGGEAVLKKDGKIFLGRKTLK